MSRRLLGTASVSRKGGLSHALPQDVDEALGQPEEVVFFLDRDTGKVEVYPESEVAPR